LNRRKGGCGQVPEKPLLIHNARELVTVGGGRSARLGEEMEDLGIIRGGSLIAEGGSIRFVGEASEVGGRVPGDYRFIDATGKVVMPGLVDPHTHLLFAGSREDEFELRLKGSTYLEIAEAGGGIVRSVTQFREAPSPELLRGLLGRMDRCLEWGVTTVEVKSGYGLNTSQEMRALEVIAEASAIHPIDIVPTFLGAHEFPPEFRSDHEGYVKLILSEMLPRVAESGLAEFCDVFCEKGVFTPEQSRAILARARELGLGVKIHAEEFTDLGGAALAAELGAASADHLVNVSRDGVRALRDSGTVAVLLPGTSFFLGHEEFAPARELIEGGAAVALATDCNPGSCMTESLPFVMTLGCLKLGMTPAEVITAATLNAAQAVGRAETIGSLAPGKKADVVVLDMPSFKYLPYHFAAIHTEIVVKEGAVVLDRRKRGGRRAAG